VDVHGVPTYVVDAGEGPAILLIHGYGDTADGWRRVVPGLLPHHRVVAVDVPPFGRSSNPRAKPLIEFFDEFFPVLFDELALEPATVVGHSLGGAIALRVAIRRPDLVARLGLVAPAGLGRRPPWWWYALTGHGPLWHAALSVPSPITPLLIRQGMKRFLDARLFHDPRRLQEEISHLVSMHASPHDFDALLEAGRCCIDSYTGTLLEESTAIACPIWMVWGRNDGFVPSQHAHDFARSHPAAEVHVLEACGHYPHIELPARFNRLLERWIADSEPYELREIA
jgi:pimeloyl-ACP methyl ester carboxylesterase